MGPSGDFRWGAVSGAWRRSHVAGGVFLLRRGREGRILGPWVAFVRGFYRHDRGARLALTRRYLGAAAAKGAAGDDLAKRQIIERRS